MTFKTEFVLTECMFYRSPIIEVLLLNVLCYVLQYLHIFIVNYSLRNTCSYKYVHTSLLYLKVYKYSLDIKSFGWCPQQ